MLDALSDNSFLQRVCKASNIDPDLIHSVECHLQDTVPRAIITLSRPNCQSANDWMTVMQGHLRMTRNLYTQLYTQLRTELENFEVVLVPLLRDSAGNSFRL